MAKRTVIKAIEVSDETHPELYGILEMLKDEGEPISRIIRNLLLRDYLVPYLTRIGASDSKVLDAIASWRRTVILQNIEYETAERRLGASSQDTSESTSQPPNEPDDDQVSLSGPF